VDPLVRDARDDDALDLIALVARCWSEYPGCVLDVHGEEPELLEPATAFARHGGRLWVAEDRGRVVGSIGVKPGTGDLASLVKLYVDPPARGRGLGERLVGVVEREVLALGLGQVELWTDTRFTHAHRLYERLGYDRRPETRELHDLSRTVEYRFTKALRAPSAASNRAVRRAG